MGAYPRETEKLLAHLPAVMNIVRRVALDAGAAIMAHYDPSGFHGDVIEKPDGPPATVADHAADDLIRRVLSDLLPGVPFITEETVDDTDFDALAAASHFWLVDPLDGTKEFRRGSPDFTVNIALIQGDQPVLGVVYAPALFEGFAGVIVPDGATQALRWNDESGREHDLRVRSIPAEGVTMLSSHSHRSQKHLDVLQDQVKLARHLHRGSSIKFCDVAAGRADLYPRFAPMSYWDTAAGDAVLRAAGGFVLDYTGQPLVYDRTNRNLQGRAFIACNDPDYFMPVIDDLSRSGKLPL